MAGPKYASLYLRGRIWWVSYYRDGKRVLESTDTENRKHAEEIRRRRDREMFDGTEGLEHEVVKALHDPRRRDAVLSALATSPSIDTQKALEEYLRHCTTYKKPQTIYSDRGRLVPFFESIGVSFVGEVTTKHVIDYLAMKVEDDDITPTTVLRYREALHAFFEWARKIAYCPSNPVDDVSRPRIADHEIRFLTLPDIEVCLRAVAADHLEPVVATAIYAGLRREELCWLTISDLDLRDGRRLLRVRGKEVNGERWTPKTGRNRVVPISKSLYHYLAKQVLRAGDGPWAFLSPEGCRWDPDNLTHRLAKLLRPIGLPWTFQDCRHTFGSQLAQAGVSLYKIAELMGNSPVIAQRHYARLVPEQMHREVEFGGSQGLLSNSIDPPRNMQSDR